ncbi:MAG: hypothetical protein K9W43_01490 [Candidatus Thorarchaeota archaeon]|nr:hypothetical protein [Candidatus Thorarchaeota archaeon]
MGSVQFGHAVPAIEHSITTRAWVGGLIINHNNIDINRIPGQYIDAAQAHVKFHYAHTSHGGQITVGLERIESANATFSFALESNSLPTEEGALCMYDGNDGHTYITPDLYWQGESGQTMTHNTLNNHPALNFSMWSWCTQLNSYSEEQVQEYLDTMSSFESTHPGVTFIYMTGNAQTGSAEGYNRYLRNEQIRNYCKSHNKVLFDFADLDSWSNGEQATYEYTVDDVTYTIPIEHPDFHGSEDAHTTYSSCEQKGKAFWWMVAMLAGWTPDGYTTTTTTTATTTGGTTTTSTGATSMNPLTDLLTNQPLLLSAIIVGVLVIVGIIVTRRK